MRRLLPWSLLGVLVCVSLGSADLVTPRRLGSPEPIAAMGTRMTIEKFKGNERASVLVSGEGVTCLGLYVFDAQGNCVARDDATTPQASDDLTVEWIPAETATYSIEVRNGGISTNAYDFAVR